MYSRVLSTARRALFCTATLGAILAVICTHPVAAQTGLIGGGFIGQAVGGISIDAHGVLLNAERDNLNKLRALRAQALAEVPGDLRQPT
ncbi:MAG TPA: hypothetical protein VGG64_01140, partial [Pirellulales bacterium]